jgi:RHS repeat-associated protein
MSKWRNSSILILTIGLLIFTKCVYAEVKNASSSPTKESATRDFEKENVGTGDVAFSYPIGAIGGLNVSLNYNSNIHKIVNNMSCLSGNIGVGWSLNLGSIVGDINNTADPSDDRYYYVSPAGTSELIWTNGDCFVLKNYKAWKITRSVLNGFIIGWTIITADGTILRYGNYDKDTGFGYGMWGNLATRYALGVNNVVCNPNRNTSSSSITQIPYQWDISDVEDVIGNHTTINYQQITDNTFNTNYTQSSYPLNITDTKGNKIQFTIASSGESHYPIIGLSQYQYDNNYIQFIDTYFNDNVQHEYMLEYETKDIFGASGPVYRRYLTKITDEFQGDDLKYWGDPSGKIKWINFEYCDSYHQANPGALKKITYSEGKVVEYTYTSPSVTNTATSFNVPGNSNEFGLSGSDFICAQGLVYRWGPKGWYQDNEFPMAGHTSYWVQNDYVVSITSANVLSIAKRSSNGWSYETLPSNTFHELLSSCIVGMGSNYFVVRDQSGSGSTYTYDFKVVTYGNGSWNHVQMLETNYFPMAGASCGNGFLSLNPVGSYWRMSSPTAGIYWVRTSGPSTTGTDEVYAGSDYFVIKSSYGGVQACKFNGTQFVSEELLADNSEHEIKNVALGNNCVAVGYHDTNLDENEVYIFTYTSDGWQPTRVKDNTAFSSATFDGVKMAFYNNILGICWKPTATSGTTGIVEYDGSNWSIGQVIANYSGLNSSSEVMPFSNGDNLFVQIYSPLSSYKIMAYEKVRIGSPIWSEEEVTSGSVLDYTFDKRIAQPGPNFLAVCVQPNGGTSQLYGWKKLYTAGFSPGYHVNFFQAASIGQKSVYDGMSTTPLTTTYLFEKGAYDNELNVVNYNKVTVTPPGNTGKTITYFYNGLISPDAENYIDIANTDEREFEGYAYRTDSYVNGGVTPLTTQTSYLSLFSPSPTLQAKGVYEIRLAKMENTGENGTTSQAFVYNDDNSQPQKITEHLGVKTNNGANQDKETEITYAFESHQTDMGVSGKHMLTQPFETRVYEKNSDGSRILIAQSRNFYSPSSSHLVTSKRIYDGTNWSIVDSIISRDDYGNILESQNIDGVKSSTILGYNSTVPVASIVNADRSKVFLENFEDNTQWPSWAQTDHWPQGNTQWSIENKSLRASFSGPATHQEFDRICYTLPDELTGKTVMEFDLRIADSDSWDFLIGMGGDLWNGQEWDGTEMAVWSAINNESWYYATGSWNLIKSGLNIGGKYHFKIIVDADAGTVDYYLDGVKMIGNASVRQSTTGIKKIVFGRYGYSTLLSTWYVDNIRVYPAGGLITTTTYDPTTLQVLSTTDANGVSIYHEYDSFGRETVTENDDKRILSAAASYFSADGKDEDGNPRGEFSSTDPNFSTSITYTSPAGHSDFSTSSGWTVKGPMRFNVPMAGEVSTVQMASPDLNTWENISRHVGAGNTIARVDFYPDNTTVGGFPHVLAFDDGKNAPDGFRFCVQYWPSQNNFQVQTEIYGNYTNVHTFALPAPIGQWYTVEIEKDALGHCYAWVYKKGAGRNYADMYTYIPDEEHEPFPVNWDVNVYSWCNKNYFYLANFYAGDFSQSTTYADGLGRTLQTQTRDGVNNMIASVEYDAAGRQSRAWRPYSYDTQNIYDGQATSGTRATSVFGITNPYSETIFCADLLSRPQTVKAVGTTTSNENTEYSYGGPVTVDGQVCSYKQVKSRSTSGQPWIISRTYTDKLGRDVKTVQNAEGGAEDIVATTSYTMLGKPFQSVAPNAKDHPGQFITTYDYNYLGRMIQKSSPDEGTSKYIYDNAGRLRFMVDAVGLSFQPSNKILYWKYDPLGRTLEKGWFFGNWQDNYSDYCADATVYPDYPVSTGGWREKYSYDPTGRLVSVLTNNDDDADTEVEEYFVYDKVGNITSKSLKVIDYNATQLYTTTYQYDLLGRVIRTDYPASTYGAVGTTSEYDMLGRTTRVGLAGTTGSFATYAYNNIGEMTTETLNPTGASHPTSTMTYDSKGRLVSIASLLNETIYYTDGSDDCYHGLIGSISTSYNYTSAPHPSPYGQVFNYDQYGRLISAIGGVNTNQMIGLDQPTCYDRNGNITSLQHGEDPAIGYTYKNQNGGTNIPQTIGSWSFSSDPTGNLTYTGSTNWNIAYDVFTQMSMQNTRTSESILFQYDGRKERVLKQYLYPGPGSPLKTLYIHGTADFPIMQKMSDGTEVICAYGPTGLLAVKINSQWYFIIKDHLGSTRVVTNVAGNVVAQYDYDPYGEIVNSNENVDIKYLFTGHEHETEGGYWNFRARMYDSKIGLFYTLDPAHQGSSPFGYAAGNPTMYVDKDGRCFWLFALAAAYLGGSAANHNFNPLKWDYHSAGTWVGIVGGLGVGAAASWAAAEGLINLSFSVQYEGATLLSVSQAAMAPTTVDLIGITVAGGAGLGTAAVKGNWFDKIFGSTSPETGKRRDDGFVSSSGLTAISDGMVSFSGDAAVAGLGALAAAPFTRGATLPYAAYAFTAASATEGVSLGADIINYEVYDQGSSSAIFFKTGDLILTNVTGQAMKGLMRYFNEKVAYTFTKDVIAGTAMGANFTSGQIYRNWNSSRENPRGMYGLQHAYPDATWVYIH